MQKGFPIIWRADRWRVRHGEWDTVQRVCPCNIHWHILCAVRWPECNTLYSDKVLRFCLSHIWKRIFSDLMVEMCTVSVLIDNISVLWSLWKKPLVCRLPVPHPGGNHYLQSLFATAAGKGWLQPVHSPCCPSHWPPQFSPAKHQSWTGVWLGQEEFMCLRIGMDEGDSQCGRRVYAPSMEESLCSLH